MVDILHIVGISASVIAILLLIPIFETVEKGENVYPLGLAFSLCALVGIVLLYKSRQ